MEEAGQPQAARGTDQGGDAFMQLKLAKFQYENSSIVRLV